MRGTAETEAFMAGDSIILNCSILGHDAENVFSVEIRSSKTASLLKSAIKAEMAPGLDRVVAANLVIWKASDYTKRAD